MAGVAGGVDPGWAQTWRCSPRRNHLSVERATHLAPGGSRRTSFCCHPEPAQTARDLTRVLGKRIRLDGPRPWGRALSALRRLRDDKPKRRRPGCTNRVTEIRQTPPARAAASFFSVLSGVFLLHPAHDYNESNESWWKRGRKDNEIGPNECDREEQKTGVSLGGGRTGVIRAFVLGSDEQSGHHGGNL